VKISELLNGQIVRARLGRFGRNGIDWSTWQNLELYVERYKNKVVGLTVRKGSYDEEVHETWAEYRPSDWDGDTFSAEDYFMQVEGLES
jgi:hypothetical protein